MREEGFEHLVGSEHLYALLKQSARMAPVS